MKKLQVFLFKNIKEKNLEKNPSFPWENFNDSKRCVCELLLSLFEDLSGLVLLCKPQLHFQLVSEFSQLILQIKNSKIGLN